MRKSSTDQRGTGGLPVLNHVAQAARLCSASYEHSPLGPNFVRAGQASRLSHVFGRVEKNGLARGQPKSSKRFSLLSAACARGPLFPGAGPCRFPDEGHCRAGDRCRDEDC